MQKKYFLFVILFFFLFFGIGCGGISFAQNLNVDSLITILKNNKLDTNKVKHFNKLSEEFIDIEEYDRALEYANKALALANYLPINNRRGWAKGRADSYHNIGIIYWNQASYPAALKNHLAALKMREDITDKKGIADSYNNIGNIYTSRADYTEALKNYRVSLKIYEDIGDKQGIAASCINLGAIYQFQGNYPVALKKYLTALKIYEDISDKQGIATSYNNVATVYQFQGNYSDALKNYNGVLKIREDTKDKHGIATTHNNIGNIYFLQGNYSNAMESYSASLKIRIDINDKQGIAISYYSIGSIYIFQSNYQEALKIYLASLNINKEIGDKQGIIKSLTYLGKVQTQLKKINEAKKYYNKALNLSIKIGSSENITYSYQCLAAIDSINGNWKEAYLHHKLFIIYRDSIDNEETKKKIIETTMTYEFDKKEAATKAEQDKKDTIATANKKRQQLILILVSVVLILVFIFAGLILRSLRVTRKQKVTIEEKNKLVEDKNKDIIDSINYAKRIQKALLKEEKHVSLHLPEHFILFKPKDIVSGDFYWSLEKKGNLINEFQNKDRTAAASEKTEAPSYWYLAAADCTGHGVPGAFMSMLGIAFLNEITAINELLSPAEILDQLRDKIVKELGQSGKEGQSKDGMDISLMRLDLETRELQWAGANNTLWIVKSPEYQNSNTEQGERLLLTNNYLQKNPNPELPTSGTQLIEIKPNKQPIGYHLAMQPFSNHVLQLKKNDIFYLFTDGYADQFGGEKEKKFMYAKLKNLLISMHGNAIKDYKENLNKTFENWKGNLEQVDDVCIIGVKI